MSQNIAVKNISDIDTGTHNNDCCEDFTYGDMKCDYVAEENNCPTPHDKTIGLKKRCTTSANNEIIPLSDDGDTILHTIDVGDTDISNLIHNRIVSETEVSKREVDLVIHDVRLSHEKPSEPHKESSNRLTSLLKNKLKKIMIALVNDDVDYLQRAAVDPAGLISDDIRRKLWPKLVGVDVFETSPRPSQQQIEDHPYYRQVVLDVNRSLKRFPPSIKENQRLAMQDQLVLLIMRILVRHPELHYYQGYHDICVTFLLVLGEETAYYVVEQLSLTHLNVFMEKTMEPTITLLNHMYPLIGKKSAKLMSFLQKSEVGVAYCLSWLITWFGHVLNNYDDVVRLFDFFIVSPPWMPMYLTAAVVLHRELDIMEQECDMACVHSLLSKIPDDLPFEKLILKSQELYACYPPTLLQYEHTCNTVNRTQGNGLLKAVVKTIKTSVPASKLTYSIVIAAAVLVTAVLYQAYKY